MRRDFSDVTFPEIFIVRVCETVGEREGRQLGYLDSPISTKGIEQAQAAGRALKRILGDQRSVCVETSPLGRAGHTSALLCAELALDPGVMSVAPQLVDCNLGAWQGLTNAQIDERYPGERRSREKDKWSYVIPGGESYADVSSRVRQWLAGPRRAQVTIAVTHRMVSRILQGCYAGMAPEDTLRRTHQQGRIYRLREGRVEEIPCDATRSRAN
ncbi:MAG TPA: histidine phosphatase family protein [Burkholderiales bacterium]|nr:histidine phosphatase family protein [Burkholderiales bacterium]